MQGDCPQGTGKWRLGACRSRANCRSGENPTCWHVAHDCWNLWSLYNGAGPKGAVRMQTLFLVLWVMSMVVAVWLQFRYKNANYPNTWQWRLVLFLSGFLLASLGGIYFMGNAAFRVLLVSILLGGTFGGLIFSYASPHSMQGIYPKRSASSEQAPTKPDE